MRALLGLTTVLAVAAACATNPPQSRQLGIFNSRDTTDGASGYVVKPTAVFWDANNVSLPNSTVIPDSCIVDTAYIPPDTTTTQLPNQLDAGSPINVSTGTALGTMTPDTIPGVIITYRNHTGGIAHVPGNDITYTVPGAPGGYPATSIQGKTAKVLKLGTIDPNPPAGDSLHVTWVLDRVGVTAVNIEFLYNSTGGSTYNRAVLCSLYDDGEFRMDPKATAAWKTGYGNLQKVHAYRWVTTFNPVSDATLMETISRFDTTKTSFP